MPRNLRFLAAPVLLGAMVLVTGCSKNTLAPAKVSGRISYKGAPIKAGSMAFHTAEGTQYPANISEDGTYSATDLPEGEMIVTVDTSHLDPAKKPAQSKDYDKRMKVMAGRMQEAAPGAEKEQPFTKIPEKYSKPNTSPITVKLTSGRQVKDIDLE